MPTRDLYVVAALLLHAPIMLSQDSLRNGMFKFNVSGAIYAQQLPLARGQKATEIHVPAFLQQRRSQEPDLATTWELDKGLKATDNPMGHGASYFRFHSWCFLKDSLELFGSAEINNAGFSWGPYNTYNIALVPRYHVRYVRAFKIRSISLDFFLKAGNFENFKLDEGLTFYNMDMQGFQAYLRYKKLRLTTSLIADLQFSTGLNIDGIRHQQLAFEQLRWLDGWHVDLELSHEQHLGPTPGTHAVNTAVSMNKKTTRVYAQYSYRFNSNFPLQRNWALVTGLEKQVKYQALTLGVKAEYRYYTVGFNEGFRKESTTHYRKTDRPTGSNFTGEQLYLISFNERPFSQWAVFTEYNAKPWVTSVSTILSADVILRKQISWTGKLDLNVIHAEGEQPFVYPFFKTGFKFEPANDTYLALYVSNSTLNLDKHYTTYYLLRHPTVQAVLKRTLTNVN